MTDNKVSLLINKQVPEFVREEYPVFISFLEAYYEFLENKQGTQKNDLTTKSKELKYISDVDNSIEEFEQQFLNSYATFLPKETTIDKALLIKNVLPLYLSKGSEKSFKLLFRMLFGGELEISYPKNNVLRASDGKWEVENAVKVSTEIYSNYTGNGTNKTFYILAKLGLSEVSVYVNGVLQTTGYGIRKESQKLVFNTAPANGAVIKVGYAETLDKAIFANRRITGVKSGATATVEKVSKNIVNNKTVLELYVSPKTLLGEFTIGEDVTTNVIGPDNNLINVSFTTISSLLRINIIDGGSSYNVGDPVIVSTDVSTTPATAIVSKTFKGTITKVAIDEGGSGFKTAARIAAVGYETTELNFGIASVQTSTKNTANTFLVFSDVISDVDPANTLLSATNWGFPGNTSTTGNTYISTPIVRAMSNASYTSIGEIATISILTANAVVSTVPTLNAEPATLTISPLTANTINPTTVYIDTYGSLGKLVIDNGGSGYVKGDEIIFTSKPMSFGTGAAAEVINVSPIGAVTNVAFVPSKITGNASVTSVSNVMVAGSGTLFTSELIVGDRIMIGNETKKVISIASDTSLNVNTTFSEIKTAKAVRKWDTNLIGGQGYTQDKIPTAVISSSTGAGAIVRVIGILGDGEHLIASGTKRPGEIEEVTITDPGEGFTATPQVDLTLFGDGTATANATLSPTYESFPGRWTTSDSILSSSDRKIQGRNYYMDYSYLLSSTVEFSKYKKIFKELMHPAGFQAYSEMRRLDLLDSSEATVETLVYPETIKTLSGKVNVANSSIYVTGINTKFNVANSLGFITLGAYIAVNSEIRVINSIISNTNLSVTSAFTYTANIQDMVVVNTAYNAVATEGSLEFSTEDGLVITVES
jgi:hypothetical protein